MTISLNCQCYRYISNYILMKQWHKRNCTLEYFSHKFKRNTTILFFNLRKEECHFLYNGHKASSVNTGPV